MTQEEKAKAYDKALERARIWKNKSGMPKDKQGILDDIFPELAESEDEKIKEELKKVLDECLNVRPQIVEENQYIRLIAWLEKQGEQKLTDKVELKFKEGDWVVYKNDICQIVKREEGCNKLITVFGIEKEFVNERNLSTARLWTIQDAKAGDVLVSGTILVIVDHLGTYANRLIIYSWYFADSEKFHGPGPTEPDRWEVKGFIPATKEQRELLFQKMKEAGYEWNTEKKELKEIEQNSAWSEDENMLQSVLWHVSNSVSNGKSQDFRCDLTEWLKSLKLRVGGFRVKSK